jgi:hypothetical protein
VRQRGIETYKLKFTNKNYKYYNGLESGKQVLGPISVQALVEWRLWTYGIQHWGTTSNSNITILERFQSKVLRLIVNAPWYVPFSRL